MFSRSRLDIHEHLFTHLTLPSVECQIDREGVLDFSFMVLTSEVLPEPYLGNLHRLAEERPWMDVVELPAFVNQPFAGLGAMIEQRCTSSRYVTVRLDDDDVLSGDYMDGLQKHLDLPWRDYAVSFPRGFCGFYGRRGFSEFRKFNKPKLALGLATVHDLKPARNGSRRIRYVYDFGRHARLDEKLPVILNGSFPAYLRTIHSQSDRFRVAMRQARRRMRVGLEQVREQVEVPSEFLARRFK